ncbi:hypothetical protein ACLBKU_13285 [Erythrobacter sp. NE805]|uniref:hypothetical protein n=1 Tax=Erythrobacter sp. NE805 TaxID=3389875 RepID=UPI00396B2E7C
MRVEPGRIALLIKGDVQSAAIGPWRDKAMGRFEISPGFFLHDAAASAPAGPPLMAQGAPGARSGELTYRREGDADLILVPVEAYGEKRAVRSSAC